MPLAFRLDIRSVAFAATLALSVSAAPSFARAGEGDAPDDSPDAQRADALFQEGKKLADEGNYAAACPKFEESQKLRPGIGTLFNEADCHEKSGKLQRAYDEFKEVIERTKAALQPDRQKVAEQRLASLEARLSKLIIAVPATRMKVNVWLDGTALPPDHLNTPLVVIAGDHRVKASTDKDEGEPFETSVTLQGGGKTTTVAIPVAPGAKMKRRVGMIVAGGVLMGVGIIAGAGSIYVFSQNDSNAAVGGGLAVLSVVTLAVGIPLFAVGFKKRAVATDNAFLSPAASPIPQLNVGATGATATWHF